MIAKKKLSFDPKCALYRQKTDLGLLLEKAES
jgi:hypothetical protein